ncbi:hypothetical protein JTB14_002910 [Gonioctena quinquepunctata]|nr:hypothetical protein JTB14_002910 [Gonioctena quinquepunctata]
MIYTPIMSDDSVFFSGEQSKGDQAATVEDVTNIHQLTQIRRVHLIAVAQTAIPTLTPRAVAVMRDATRVGTRAAVVNDELALGGNLSNMHTSFWLLVSTFLQSFGLILFVNNFLMFYL